MITRHNHKLDDRIIGRQIARHSKILALLKGEETLDPRTLRAVVQSARLLAAVRSVADIDDTDAIATALAASATAGSRLFAMPEVSDAPGVWTTSFFAALCVRDRDSLEVLAAVDSAPIRARPGVIFSAGTLIDALVAWYRGDSGASESLVSVLGNAQRDAREGEVWAGRIVEPQARLFFALAEGRSAADFNAELSDALKEHKKYWGHPSRGVEGLLALGPLAAAACAHDAGLAVDVVSDYIPQELIRRTGK